MAAVSEYTWDGLPVAPDEPHGAAILARRSGEYLILHRAHRGRGYQGDWAWTPPSGSRLPGEPVLVAALRELAEETGLQASAADLRALDLRGKWAHFGLNVPEAARPRLDAEHDRFEWLPAAAAISRCRPAAVARGIRIAESVRYAEIRFRPLAGTQHVAVADGSDVALLGHHPPTGDQAVCIDCAMSDRGRAGRGVGPQLIWSYVRDVVLPAYPAVQRVVASPDATSLRLIRALQMAGFAATGETSVPGVAGRQRLCVLDRGKFFGHAGAGCE